MKKLSVLPLMTALILLLGSVFIPAFAQDTASDNTPTFYRLTPGMYMNGWPRFTVTYPKDWVERDANILRGEVFTVSSPISAPDRPRFAGGGLAVSVSLYLQPLEMVGKNVAGSLRSIATDVTIVSDKPSQLRDSTPTRECEFSMVMNGVPSYLSYLATKKGDTSVSAYVYSDRRIGEDLKNVLYSLQFQPGKDEPVKVPPDVQELLHSHCSAYVAHDLTQVMADYSDTYLNSGTRKGGMERFHKQVIGRMTSCEIVITDFVAGGDRAYLAGFISGYFGKSMLLETSIIKENGKWKWYGNQREVAP